MPHPTKQQIRGYTFDGNGRQACVIRPCPFRSIAGMVRGEGLCPYHWGLYAWGKTWADHALPGYAAAAKHRQKEQQP